MANGINRFDQPAESNYFNTYVPLPYNEIMNTVSARQAQVEQGQKWMDQAQMEAELFNAIPNSEDEKKVKEIQNFIQEWSGKYINEDMSDPVIKRQAMNEYRTKLNRPLIKDIEDSYASWSQNQQVKRKLQAEGEYNDLLDEDPATGYDTTAAGRYGYMTPTFKNARPVAEQYFNNLQDTILYDKNGNPMVDPQGYNISGVTTGHINNVINERWRDFADTYEGKQAVTIAAKRMGIKPGDLTEEQRRGIATGILQDVGKEYVRTNLSGSRYPEWMTNGSGKDTDNSYTNTTQQPPVRTKDDFDPLGIGKITFSDKDEIYVGAGNDSQDVQNTLSILDDRGQSYILNKNYTSSAQAQLYAKQSAEKINKIRESIPQLAGLSDKETYNAYRQLIQDGKAFPDLPQIDLPQVARNDLANYLASSITNRSVMVRDDRGSSDLRLATDSEQGSALRDLGYSTQKLKEELIKFGKGDASALVTVGGLAQNAPESGMVVLEVQDLSNKGQGKKGGKGQTRTLLMSTNEEFSAIMSPSNEIYDNIRNFREGITPMGKDQQGRIIAAKVTPKPYKDETDNKWKYEYDLEEGYIDPSGQFIPTGKTDMSNIRKFQNKQLINSNFINSRIDYTKTAEPSF